MNQIRTLVFIASLALIASIAPAYAVGTVIVTYSSDATMPTENVLSSQTAVDASSLTWRWSTEYDAGPPIVQGNRRDVGQFFDLSEAATLTAVGVRTPGASAATTERPFSLSIVQVSGLSGGGGMTSGSTITVLQSFQGILPHLGGGNRYVNFAFDPYYLEVAEAGTRYAFLWEFDEYNSESSMSFRTVNPDGFRPGFMINYNNDGNEPVQGALSSGFDHYILIPEPSVYAAMAGILVLLVAMFKRRRQS